MADSRTVDAAEFREAIAPTVNALRAFANAVDDLLERHRLPTAESRAMSEIAAEQVLARRSAWTGPISDTHTFGAMTLRAAADYVRGFAELFTADRIPMWAHLVLERAARVISAWLNEPGVEPLERAKRGLVEQLYSAREILRLNLPGADANREHEWTNVAAAFNWTVTWSNRKPVVDGTQRPSIPAGISRLIVDDEERSIGRMLWSRLSAVTHVSWWGIEWALQHPAGEVDAAGFAPIGIGTDQAAVSEQAFCILRALQAAATTRAILTGTQDEPWQQASRQADQLAVALLRVRPPEGSPEGAGPEHR